MRLISDFMTSQPGKQSIAIHILPNISRPEGYYIMKFGQLIECNIKKKFLEKFSRNVAEKLFPGAFLNNYN